MESQFDILGTVTEFIGKKGKLLFLDSNLSGKKRVMVTMVNEKGTKIECLLSTTLSEQVRDKSVKLANLVTFSYGVNEDDRHYIVRPQGTVLTVLAKDIVAEEIESVDVDIEDFIAL